MTNVNFLSKAPATFKICEMKLTADYEHVKIFCFAMLEIKL